LLGVFSRTRRCVFALVLLEPLLFDALVLELEQLLQ
jgi:hypothetical protein